MYVVRKIEHNKTATGKNGKPYKYSEFSIEGNGETKQTRVFNSSDMLNQIRDLKVGDMVDCTFDTSQYRNLTGVKKITGPAAVEAAAVAADNKFSKDTEPVRIARSVALKAATEIVTALLEKDGYKKTITAEALASDALGMAKTFDKYLTLADDEKEMEAAVGSAEFEPDPF